MLRKAFVGLLALAASACATPENAVYPRPPVATPPPYAHPQAPNPFATAPSAEVHSELFVCNYASANLGEIGDRGQSLRYSPYMLTPAGALLRNPTQSACLSSGFGWRASAGGGGREHTGLDLANPNGGFVYAAGAGRIAAVGWRGGYGLVVEIDHGAGVRSFYAHLSEVDPRLRAGVHVPAGAPIARMGMSGNATGVHLHYEVSVDGLRVDPLAYGQPEPVVVTPVVSLSPEGGAPIDKGMAAEE